MTRGEYTRLKEFYGVGDADQLIEAMDRHITKLQDKLRRYEKPEVARTVVSEGKP